VGYRARIALAIAEDVDNWIEIAVLGGGDVEKRACEFLLEDEIGAVSRPGLPATPTIARECDLAPLLPMGSSDASYLLVDPKKVTRKDVMIIPDMPRKRQPPDDAFTAEVTSFGRHSSKAGCEAALARLVSGREEERARSAAAAREWVQARIKELESRREAACAEVEALAHRCRPGRRTMKRSQCEVSQHIATRACELQEKELKALHDRVAKQPALLATPPPPAISPVCQPSSEL